MPLTSAWDLTSFSWLQRGTVQDIMAFMAKTVAERTRPTQRQSVQQNEYVAHVHVRPASEGISGVLVSDVEYPGRVAYSLLNKALDEFTLKVPRSMYDAQVNRILSGGANAPSKGEGILNSQNAFPQGTEYLTRYQDPRQADQIMQVQQQLDDTKVVLHQTIDSVLRRGEDLDKLVEKSSSLNEQSKMFYSTARKTNSSCCTIM